MHCANCDGYTAVIEHTEGATDDGQFSELWKCENCGATGTVKGDAGDAEDDWERDGRVFNG